MDAIPVIGYRDQPSLRTTHVCCICDGYQCEPDTVRSASCKFDRPSQTGSSASVTFSIPVANCLGKSIESTFNQVIAVFCGKLTLRPGTANISAAQASPERSNKSSCQCKLAPQDRRRKRIALEMRKRPVMWHGSLPMRLFAKERESRLVAPPTTMGRREGLGILGEHRRKRSRILSPAAISACEKVWKVCMKKIVLPQRCPG